MSAGPHHPFVSVKFSPVGRTHSFLMPELALDSEGAATPEQPPAPIPPIPALHPGDAVVVQTSEGRALGTVTRSVNELAARKCPPAGSELQVVRRATREDVITRLKHQQREQEAHRIVSAGWP
jgi:hypothetical protein